MQDRLSTSTAASITDAANGNEAVPSLQAVPSTVRMAGETVRDLATAQAYTRSLALGHYENFSVVSVLLPRHLRQHFCNLYAFCRTADDLGDEVSDTETARRLLADFRQQIQDCYAGRARTAVIVALAETIHQFDIPIKPFLDLIDAFEQDQRVTRYQTASQLHDYCRRSADPVGRLVLYVCGYRDARRQELSDRTCTALQLVNFWQDVRRDIADRNRIYIPKDTMDRFGVTEAQIVEGRCDDNYRRAIQFEVETAEAMFAEGQALLPMLDASVRAQVALFGKGGQAVATAIRKQNFDTLSRRPALSRWQKGQLMLGTMAELLRQSLLPNTAGVAT